MNRPALPVILFLLILSSQFRIFIGIGWANDGVFYPNFDSRDIDYYQEQGKRTIYEWRQKHFSVYSLHAAENDEYYLIGRSVDQPDINVKLMKMSGQTVLWDLDFNYLNYSEFIYYSLFLDQFKNPIVLTFEEEATSFNLHRHTSTGEISGELTIQTVDPVISALLTTDSFNQVRIAANIQGADQRIEIRAFDADNQEQWRHHFAKPGEDLTAMTMQTASDDSLRLLAKCSSAAGKTVRLSNLDRNGKLEWTFNYQKTGDLEIDSTSMTIDSDGNSYVAGRANTQAGDSVAWLIKVDATGHLVWENRFQPTPYQHGEPKILFDETGNVYLVSPLFTSYPFTDEMEESIGFHQSLITHDGVVVWDHDLFERHKCANFITHLTSQGEMIILAGTDSCAYFFRVDDSGSLVDQFSTCSANNYYDSCRDWMNFLDSWENDHFLVGFVYETEEAPPNGDTDFDDDNSTDESNGDNDQQSCGCQTGSGKPELPLTAVMLIIGLLAGMINRHFEQHH